MPVIFATPAVHFEFRLLFIESECHWDELVRVKAVAIVAGHHNASLTNLGLGPSALGNCINAEQTVTAIRGKHREEV